jgi:IclR family transcriptional regulator, pca regulon regulatory protein
VVQVIDRIHALLSVFSEEEPVLPLHVCAERAGLSRSSAHRLLGALEEWNLVERDKDSNWEIGPAVLRLAAVRLSHKGLIGEVIPRLRALGQAFHAATAYSIPNVREMVYIQRSEGTTPFAPTAKLGSTAPIWLGAAGHSVLANLDAAEREALLDCPEWRALPTQLRTQIKDEIGETEARGYSIDRGVFTIDVAGVAVALCEAPGAPVAAMSLILPVGKMDDALAAEMGEALIGLASEATMRTLLPRASTADRAAAATRAVRESKIA